MQTVGSTEAGSSGRKIVPRTLHDWLFLFNLALATAVMLSGYTWLHRPAVGYIAIAFGFALIGGERLGRAKYGQKDLETSQARVAATGMLTLLPLMLLVAVFMTGLLGR